MDKLKQVLKYQFWILLVVALILPVVGWSMAKSGMVKETEDRTKKLTETTGKLKVGPDDPNIDWQKGVAAVNDIQKSQVRDAWMTLYERQKQFMTWPTNVPDDPTKLEPQHLQFYLKKYPAEIERVRQIVKPLDDLGESGLIDLSDGLMPHPEDDWLRENRAPTAKEVEGAQEDVWLLAGLLKSIAAVNSSATSQYDAPIREVVALYLRGGSDNFTAATVPGQMGMSGDDMEMEMRPNRAALGSPRRGGLGAAGQGFTGSVSFNPDEEFGLEVPDPEEAAAAEAAAPGGMRVDDDGPLGGGMALRGPGSAKMLRYVQDKPEWRTRGFYMELVMDHRKVPDLLVALANSDWPVRVTRVHQADVRDEELVTEEANPAGRALGGAPGAVGGRPRMAGAAGIAGRAAGQFGTDLDDDERFEKRGRLGGVLGGRGGMGMRGQARPGRAAGAASASGALEDHMLANVAIDGLITIFKKPPEEEAPAADSQEVPGSQTDEPATAEETMNEAANADVGPDSTDENEPAAVEEAPAEDSTEGDPGDKPAAERPEPEEKPASSDGAGS